MRTGTVELLAWVNRQTIAELCGVDRTTAMRWKRGDRRPPASALLVLELMIGGHVGPAAGPAWHGWWFNLDGELCCPDSPRWRVTPAELRAYFWLRMNGAIKPLSAAPAPNDRSAA